MSEMKIPQHNLVDKFNGEMIVLWQITENNHRKYVNYAHRDDYYMFIFIEQGYVKMAIDFDEHVLYGPSLAYTLPEQVHLMLEYKDLNGWALIVDKMFVDSTYKELLQSSQASCNLEISEYIELQECISMLNRRINRQTSNKEVVLSLIQTYIGVIAEIYQASSGNKPTTKRYSVITSQFRTLLSTSYKTLKSPSHYANALNISPVYLNEIIKRTMGITVGSCIHNEVMIHAKRLLFYTNLSVKQIAFELGYEDWAYFTRIFTKTTSLTPTQFRAKYLK